MKIYPKEYLNFPPKNKNTQLSVFSRSTFCYSHSQDSYSLGSITLMDPYSAFLSHLDSKIDAFKKEILADVQSLIKETEKIQESKESEITKVMKKAIDERTLSHENDKENWMKERNILLNQITKAEEPVQENEPDDLEFGKQI